MGVKLLLISMEIRVNGISENQHGLLGVHVAELEQNLC